MAELERTVGLLEASVYGIGLILGAGIYAILGEAVAETGESIVIALLLAAGVATFTGLSYAELASRYPKGEGEYLYVWAAFGNKRLSELAALCRVLTGIISAAAVALAFGGYLASFVPFSVVPVAIGLLLAMSFVNFWGIEESTRLNVLFTVIEVGGLLLIIAIGVGTWGTVDVLPDRQGVSVADDGTEIPQDIRDRLFEPGATTREDGTGFGLAIVADIVRAHGWEISATDSQACGARFAMPGMCLDAVAAEDPYPSGGVATSFDSVIGRSSRISPHSAARTPGWCRVSPDE